MIRRTFLKACCLFSFIPKVLVEKPKSKNRIFYATKQFSISPTPDHLKGKIIYNPENNTASIHSNFDEEAIKKYNESIHTYFNR